MLPLALAVVLVALAAVRPGADPELESAAIAAETARTRAAVRRDLMAAQRGVLAVVSAAVRILARAVHRNLHAMAVALGVITTLSLVGVVPGVVGVSALTLGWLAGRALVVRRGIRREGVAPRQIALGRSASDMLELMLAGRMPARDAGAPRGRLPLRLSILGVLLILPLARLAPGEVPSTIATLAALLAIAAALATSIRLHRARVRVDRSREVAAEATREQIAAMSGCRPDEVGGALDPYSALIQVSIPGRAYAKLAGNLDAELVRFGLTQWEGELQSAPSTVHGGSDLWLRLVPATAPTLRRRELLASTDGLVLEVRTAGRRTELTLAHGTSPARADTVNAWARRELGADLVEWDPHADRAVVERLSPKTREVRMRLAELTKLEPHRLAVQITEGVAHIESIYIPGAPSLDRDPQKRREAWLQLALSLPDGSNGWRVEEDAAKSDITLVWGAPRELPRTVPLADLLPAAPTPEAWSSIPLGLGEDGTPRGFDLTLGPHSLLVGPTGSGKTVGVLAIAAQQLMRGFDLAIIDPTKGGVDFASIEPHTRGFARTFEDAAALIRAVYAEGVRRKPLLLQHGAVKWDELPADVRDREGVRPVALIVDELASLLAEAVVPRGLPKDDPDVLEAQVLNGHKAILSLYINKIARELRFVGIHLLLAMQRPDAAFFGGGEGRSNLTSVAQLAKPGSPPSLDAIRMIFTGDSAQEAFETLRALDDGRSRGLGVVAGDGGGVDGVRVAYIPMRDLPGLLVSRGMHPRHDAPFAAAVSRSTSAPRRADKVTGRRITELVEESEVDLGVVDIDFDGLFDAAAPTTPDPWATAAAARAELTADSQPQPAQTAAHAAHVMDESDLFGAPRRIVPVEDGF